MSLRGIEGGWGFGTLTKVRGVVGGGRHMSTALAPVDGLSQLAARRLACSHTRELCFYLTFRIHPMKTNLIL